MSRIVVQVALEMAGNLMIGRQAKYSFAAPAPLHSNDKLGVSW